MLPPARLAVGIPNPELYPIPILTPEDTDEEIEEVVDVVEEETEEERNILFRNIIFSLFKID